MQVCTTSSLQMQTRAAPATCSGRGGAQRLQPSLLHHRSRAGLRPVAAKRASDLSQEDLEEQLEEFMRRQAEIESGAATRPKVEPGKVLGADEVSEEEARSMCRDIVQIVKRLKELRDMSLNEVRLTVAIEDPRARERRLMGMEDSSGVSRDEMAAALEEVSEGRVPADRIALRELHREMTTWPFLEADATTSSSEGGGDATLAAQDKAAGWRDREVLPPMGRDPNEPRQDLMDSLPDFVGYGALYLVSGIPILIVVGTLFVLWQNSLR